MNVVLLLLAAICFIVASAMCFNKRIIEFGFMSLGLFLWVLVPLLGALHVHA